MDIDLESVGWRQGCLVRSDDIVDLLSGVLPSIPDGAELIIISQSCDLAQSIDAEPAVEALLATEIRRTEGNYTYNKNARILHTTIQVATSDRRVVMDKHLRLAATSKLSIPKERFAGRVPSRRRTLSTAATEVLVHWLASRYSRPAFPTAFNDSLAAADPGAKKRKLLAKRISPYMSGLYINLLPNRDLRPGEQYKVNLLGALLPDAKKHRDSVEQHVGALQEVLKCAGMQVATAVRAEDELSVATMRRFQRFYFDDISHRNNEPLPYDC
ncbi:MAG: hypothetical protein WD078_16540 [Woeseia sp.]